MSPEPGWYPVALAGDLEPATSTGTRLFGRELVVWRDAAGQVHVWEDRCPHRGMRLSFGFVRGDHIACLYHGWRFDGTGRCRFIPAHPQLDVPSSITVDRFASVERLGFVWVSLDGMDAPGQPPGGNVDAAPVRSVTIEAPLARVRALLAATAPPSSFGEAVVVDGEGPLLWFRSGTDVLYAALQPVAQGIVAVHLAADPGVVANLRAISLWGEAVRRAAEARFDIGISA